jgi:hypothetical protein
MATTYGFRIYVIQAFPNRKKDRDPLDLSASGDTRDRILELLESLAMDGTVFIQPQVPPAPGNPPKPTVSVTVGEPFVVRQDLIHLQVSEGQLDAHRKATSPGGPHVSLGGHSAEADHYVTLLFPTKEQDRMIMIAQTFRRRDPVARLISLMQKRSYEFRKQQELDQKEERARLRSEGETLPPKQTFYKLVFDRRQATDNAYLDRIIDSAKRVRAIFQAHVPADRNGGTRVEKTLGVELYQEAHRKAGKTISRRWTNRTRGGDVTTHAAGVDELAEALHDQGLLTEDEEAPYNSAALSLTGGEDGTATIAVDTLRDVFTYPVSDGQPSVVYYYDKVVPRLRSVAAEEGIEVDTIDSVEVEQCLDDSTFAP